MVKSDLRSQGTEELFVTLIAVLKLDTDSAIRLCFTVEPSNDHVTNLVKNHEKSPKRILMIL